jgi:hypothetical protein
LTHSSYEVTGFGLLIAELAMMKATANSVIKRINVTIIEVIVEFVWTALRCFPAASGAGFKTVCFDEGISVI